MSSERGMAALVPTPLRRRAGLRLAVAASMMVGLGVACGGGGNSTSQKGAASTTSAVSAGASIPAGYSQFTDSADHFSIAIPTSWRKIDLASPGAAQALQDLVKANPKLKSAFGKNPADMVSKGTKLYAVDVAAATDPAPNVNIIVSAALGITDGDLASEGLSVLRAGYQKAGATVIGNPSSIPLAGHKALQIELLFPLTQPTGDQATIMETQVLVAAHDFLYIMTFAGSSPEFSTIKSTFSVS